MNHFTDCPHCNGLGINTVNCRTCGGTGAYDPHRVPADSAHVSGAALDESELRIGDALRELERVRAILADPVAVQQNMKAGKIAMPTNWGWFTDEDYNLRAENERLRAACKFALGFDAHDEDCATQHPRHARTCDCERADVKDKLKAALGA